jgi:hypothetical protein
MKHETTHSQTDEGLADLHLAFVVPAQALGTAPQAEGTFDDPASGQHGEAARGVGAANDLQCPLAHPAHPLNELARLTSVGPLTTQLAIQSEGLGQEPTRAIAILHVGYRGLVPAGGLLPLRAPPVGY